MIHISILSFIVMIVLGWFVVPFVTMMTREQIKDLKKYTNSWNDKKKKQLGEIDDMIFIKEITKEDYEELKRFGWEPATYTKKYLDNKFNPKPKTEQPYDIAQFIEKTSDRKGNAYSTVYKTKYPEGFISIPSKLSEKTKLKFIQEMSKQQDMSYKELIKRADEQIKHGEYYMFMEYGNKKKTD